MLTFPYLKIFTVFSSFPLIIGDDSRDTNTTQTAVEIYHDAVDGEQFIKRIIQGEKISEKPGYLLFTAPYKLCEGGCKENDSNFAMAFPLFVGRNGIEAYKRLFSRDFGKLASLNKNLPFKKKTTKVPFTLCPTFETTITPETISEVMTELPTTVTCPMIPPGLCQKKKKYNGKLNVKRTTNRVIEELNTKNQFGYNDNQNVDEHHVSDIKEDYKITDDFYADQTVTSHDSLDNNNDKGITHPVDYNNVNNMFSDYGYNDDDNVTGHNKNRLPVPDDALGDSPNVSEFLDNDVTRE